MAEYLTPRLFMTLFMLCVFIWGCWFARRQYKIHKGIKEHYRKRREDFDAEIARILEKQK